MEETQRPTFFPLGDYRLAAILNPFDHDTRQAGARRYAAIAMQFNDKGLMQGARAELIEALRTDYSSADMLIKLVMIDLALDEISEAQHYYTQFKQVAKRSPFIKLVNDAKNP